MRLFGVLALIFAIFWGLSPVLAKCPSYMVLTCQNRENRSKTAKIRENRRIPVESLSGRRLGVIETSPTGRVRVYGRRGDVIEDFRFLMPTYRRN